MVVDMTLVLKKDRSELHISDSAPLPYREPFVVASPMLRVKRKNYANWVNEYRADLVDLYQEVIRFFDEIQSDSHIYSYDIQSMETDFYQFVYMHSSNALK